MTERYTRRDAIRATSVVTGMAIAGCVGGEPRLDRPPEITLSSNSMNATADGFRVDGDIQEGGSVTQKNTYRDVVVCLYGGQKQKLYESTPVDLEPPKTEAHIQITTDTAPTYVVLDSTDFWDVPDISVVYYVRTTVDGETGFLGKVAHSPEDLPVQSCSPEFAQ